MCIVILFISPVSCVFFCLPHITVNTCLLCYSDEVISFVSFRLRVSSSQSPKSYEPLDSAAPQYVWSLWKHITDAKFNSFHLNLFQYRPLVSFGCGGGRHFGPAAPELPGVAGGACRERQQESGYFLDEKRSDGNTERKLISCAAGGKLRRGQLHLPQERWNTPQSHCGPDPRGWN